MNLEIRFRNWMEKRDGTRDAAEGYEREGGSDREGKKVTSNVLAMKFRPKLSLVSRLRIPRQCLGSPSVLASRSCLIGTYIRSEMKNHHYITTSRNIFLSFFHFVRFVDLSLNFILTFRPSLLFDNLISRSLDFADAFSHSFRDMFETRYRANLCTRKKNPKESRSLIFCLF